MISLLKHKKIRLNKCEKYIVYPNYGVLEPNFSVVAKLIMVRDVIKLYTHILLICRKMRFSKITYKF